MGILRSGIKSGAFIEQMEGLVRLCSAKRINIRPGITPCTNGKDTIYLPWLPNDASEEDKMRFFNFAAHEQSHFYGESDVPKMSKNQTIHQFENAVDDMRCERLQEEEYPGLKQYRAPFLGTYARDILSKEFETASISKDIVQFLHAVQSYTYLKVRYTELDVTEPINVNDEILQAYDKYVSDLIPQIRTHRTFKETLELGRKIYDRMKDLIREEMEKKTPPPPKPEPASSKPKESKDEDDSDGRDNSGDDTESKETRDTKEPSDDNTEGESEEAGSTGDDTDETGEDTNESSEKGTGGNEDTEGEDDPKDGEAGKEDEGSEKGADDDEEDTAPDKREPGSGEERDSDETGEEDGSAGDRTEDEPEDLSEADEGSDGDTGTDESPSSGGVPCEEGKTTDDATEDSGDGEDTGEADSPKDKKHGGNPGETTKDHEPETEPDDTEKNDEPDPVSEKYEEARKEWVDAIEEAVGGVLQDVEDRADELKTINEENKEMIKKYSAESDSPYMVDPGVVDRIEYNRSVDMYEAEMRKNMGITMLGNAGARLTRVFVAESYPRHVHNQYHGRFDMRSFIADPADRRMDIYSRKIGARLDKAAVSLMIDNSGSMEDCIGPIYCILSGLLHYLGHARIPTEAVGFTAGTASNDSYRDVPVHLTIVKKFEDPYDSAVMQRCVPPFHMEQNAEVDCLRYMVPRLLARPETKKVLFILGDGVPDIGEWHLSQKLAAAYKEYIRLCKEAGIIVFGFGIKCDLSWVFGEDFVSVDTSNVGDKLLTKLTEVLSRPPVHMKRLAA